MILQQDAFDPIDQMTPMERQKYMLEKVLNIVKMNFNFENFEEVGSYFRKVINSLKQINYSEFKSDQFQKYESELESIINEKKVA